MSKRVLLATALFMTMSDVSAQPPFSLSLDGEWSFRVDSMKVGISDRWFADSTDRATWQRVQIPNYWEAYPGLALYDGWGWFARSVRLPKPLAPLSMHFAGVDDEAIVWMNGVEVGSHSGYTDPFTVDISSVVHEGENSVVVLVKDNGGGGGIYRSVTILETFALENFLKGPYSGMPAIRSADWVREAVIYSVYLRSFSPEGTFAGLERRIPELKNLGVTVLWLLPIHPVGEKARKGPLGSPYSVQDYYGINPEFGMMADFKRLLATAHKNGLKLIIDLVANHTAWDSKLIREHPGWFARDGKGAIKPPNPDWTDVAQLDYSKPGLRQYMTDMMVWWVRDIGIDGFRCDVAELVPTSFWDEARSRLNRIKPVMMLSEGSIPEHHARAFDITYSWNIYDVLGPLLSGKRPVALLDQILKNEESKFPVGSLRLRFSTNHDKNAWDSPAILKFGEDGLRLATVLVNTMPGVPLIYTGEEIPNDKKLSLFEKVNVNWSQARKMESLYRTLFQLRKEHKALSRGQMVRVGSPDSVYAFVRVAGTDRILSVLNFGSRALTASLQLPTERIFPGKKQVVVEDVFARSRTTAASDELKQMQVELAPRGYAVFVIR